MLQIMVRACLESQWRPAYSQIHRCLLQKHIKNWHRSLSITNIQCSKLRKICKGNMSEKKLSRYFVDHRKVRVIGGKGGDGIACFLSEPRKEFGGPNGGDGGDGGHVIFKGSSQQYMGQEEYYSEQYSHGQGSSESMNQQYYPDGHGDYAYQQSSYSEQSYDRSFEDSTQHYYEGGNSQYSQQQAGYQQGATQQQTYSQQQYSNQQTYPGQQQGYGPAQGTSSQYSSYQQGQGQQYGSYRASQTGPSAQQQRSYGYEQGQYGNYQQ